MLQDKTAIVTGSTSGIGRGIALSLAANGAAVAINDLPGTETEQAAQEIVTAIENDSGSAIYVPADVTEPKDVQKMVNEVLAEFGSIDILVTSAGISSSSPAAEMPIEMWENMIDVNLRGTFLPVRNTLPTMIENGSGKIITIASQMGLRGEANLTHYCAAKSGVIGFTRALAREVAPEIHVNGVAPGPIDTPMLRESSSKDELASLQSRIPMDRIGTVDDVVPTVTFLASSKSDYYTGKILSPDGGDVMH